MSPFKPNCVARDRKELGTPDCPKRRVQRDARDDPRQGQRQDDEEAERLPAEERVPLDGERDERAGGTSHPAASGHS